MPDLEDKKVTVLPVSELRSGFSDAISRVAFGRDRIIIDRNGKHVAALVSLQDIELLQAIEDQLDMEDAEKALKERGSVSLEDAKAKLGL